VVKLRQQIQAIEDSALEAIREEVGEVITDSDYEQVMCSVADHLSEAILTAALIRDSTEG
jgi:hypothetical protein